MTALSPAGNNLTLGRGWQNYTPTLQGQTDQPGVAYSTQEGRFAIIGGLVHFKFKLVTSGTTTKTTTTDTVTVNLPLLAATNTGDVTTFTGRVENATAVASTVVGEILSNTQVAQFRNYVLATSSAIMTWATTNPGIGVLSNVITVSGSGSYEYAAV